VSQALSHAHFMYFTPSQHSSAQHNTVQQHNSKVKQQSKLLLSTMQRHDNKLKQTASQGRE